MRIIRSTVCGFAFAVLAITFLSGLGQQSVGIVDQTLDLDVVHLQVLHELEEDPLVWILYGRAHIGFGRIVVIHVVVVLEAVLVGERLRTLGGAAAFVLVVPRRRLMSLVKVTVCLIEVRATRVGRRQRVHPIGQRCRLCCRSKDRLRNVHRFQRVLVMHGQRFLQPIL